MDLKNQHSDNPIIQYGLDVLSGKIITGKLQRRFVERHFYDLETAKERGYYFDEDAAHHVIKFFDFLRHSKGKWAGQKFELSLWQKFLLWVLFGWKNIDDDTRRFRLAYNEIARKNGKSTLAAGIALYLLVADGEGGPEVYSAATKRDQAKIVFLEAKRMVRASPLLNKKITSHQNNLSILNTAAKFEPLSSDEDSLDGLNVHGAIVDEVHAHKTRAVFDVLDTATGAREQPLIFCITTAGFNKTGIAAELRDYGRRILEGFDVEGGTKDDTFFVFIACLDEGDDWRDESVWIKANPNLGISVSLKDLRIKCQKAINNPGAQNSFRCKHLNEWVNQETRYIPIEKWDRVSKIPIDIHPGDSCHAGLDLAKSGDLVAWVLVFPKENGEYHILPRFFIPKDIMQERTETDRIDYFSLEKQGYIKATNGEVVDYDSIFYQIDNDMREYDIKDVCFDRWGSTATIQKLQDKGAVVVEMGQGTASMTSTTKELLKLVLEGKIIHGGNPLLRWNADNLVVVEDDAGNLKPSKKRSRQKIDGMVAMIMGLDRALRNIGSEKSVYEDRGIIVI